MRGSAATALLILLLTVPIAFVPTSFGQYYLRVYFSSAEVNGVSLSASNPTITVSPGSRISGYLEVTVDNNRGGAWITPVIGTASWSRGWHTCISGNAPSGRSTQRFNLDLTAPNTPGTYYIGVFTGWMYSCDEVASNDHPPQYGDGDDVWDMPQQGWEEVLSNGQASSGPYRMPGRAIRVVVQQQQASLSVQPTSWSPTVQAGSSASQVFTVSISGGTARGVTVSRVSGPSWLTINPANLGDIASGQSRTFTATASPPSGTSGQFSYRIRVSGSNTAPVEIQGTINVQQQQEMFTITGLARFGNDAPMRGGYIIIEPVSPAIEPWSVIAVTPVNDDGSFSITFSKTFKGSNIQTVKVTPYFRGMYFSSSSKEVIIAKGSSASVNFKVQYIDLGSRDLASRQYIRDERGEPIIIVEVEPQRISRSTFSSLNIYVYVAPKHIYDYKLTKAVLDLFMSEDIVFQSFGPEPPPGKFAFIAIATQVGWYAYSPPPPPRNLLEQIVSFFSDLLGPALSTLIGQFIPGFGIIQSILERYIPSYVFNSGPPRIVNNLDPNIWDVWQANWDEYGTSQLPGLSGWLGASISFKIKGSNAPTTTGYYYLQIKLERVGGGPFIDGWVTLEQKFTISITD